MGTAELKELHSEKNLMNDDFANRLKHNKEFETTKEVMNQYLLRF